MGIAVFLAVELPLSCITALHTISSSVVEFLDYNLVGNIILFINVIIYTSYPLNFAIYCGMSRQFRKTFRSLFLTPVRLALCSSNVSGEELEGLDGVTSNKSKWLDTTSSTKLSKVLTPANASTVVPTSSVNKVIPNASTVIIPTTSENNEKTASAGTDMSSASTVIPTSSTSPGMTSSTTSANTAKGAMNDTDNEAGIAATEECSEHAGLLTTNL